MISTTEVTLSPEKTALARAAGERRYKRRVRDNHHHRWNRSDDAVQDVELHIEGCGSEIAAGVVTGYEWVEREELDHDGDLAPGWQVRGTPYATGRLLLHPEDDDLHWFILVRGKLPTYQVVGYILGSEGKRVATWKELQPGRPCFVVEATDLIPYE